MTQEASSYRLWGLAVLNSIVFILLAFSFFKPRVIEFITWRPRRSSERLRIPTLFGDLPTL